MDKIQSQTEKHGKGHIRLLLIIFILIAIIWNKQVSGSKVYFNKPVSWENLYAYFIDDNGKVLIEEPGIELEQEKDYIYSLKVPKEIRKLGHYKIVFNSGEYPNNQYNVEADFVAYHKIYNITSGLGEFGIATGEWLDYNKNIKIGKIPTTTKKIKNIIFMIGDGMGENHVIAARLYRGETLNIQKIKNKSYVKTASMSTVTDSAAGATALSAGCKTINQFVGKDKNGNDVENLTEYANSKGLKTGIFCTQILNHATPAGFSVHNWNRYNYMEIAESQTKSFVDLMLGGGRDYFSMYQYNMEINNYKWINYFSELQNIDKDEKVIGTFAHHSICEEADRVSLADITNAGLARLENENGFFVMIEGSDIDTFSHIGEMSRMLVEMLDFDDAVGVAMEYVDKNPDTLLVVTADHETGGINLDGVTSANQLNNFLFTSNGQHTERDVVVYAYGKGAEELTKYDIIDNTSIYQFVKQGLMNQYE